MPFLIRFMLRHAALGFLLGIMGASAAIAADFAGLRSLAALSDMGWVGLSAFAFLTGLTIGGLQIGFAVMLLPYDEAPPSGGKPRRIMPVPQLQPLPVRVPRRGA